MKSDESELRLAQLQQQLPANEAGCLMHLIEDAAREDEDDLETQECKNLFKNIKFFLSREVRCCSWYSIIIALHLFPLSFFCFYIQ